MLPYAGRIADGRFHWAGVGHHLPPNLPGEAMAIHGVGFWRGWRVATLADDAVTLALDHAGDAHWPWPFRAEQEFALTGDALTITAQITNLAGIAVQAGVGFHPYFDSAGARLQFAAPRYWPDAGRNLPGEPAPTPEGWDFGRGRAVAGLNIDHSFGGWNGQARIDWAGRRHALLMTASAPISAIAVVYIPPDADFFCFEPMPHLPNALNRHGGEGAMSPLAPGESRIVRMHLAVARPQVP
jgi:aldose 1-epimerase